MRHAEHPRTDPAPSGHTGHIGPIDDCPACHVRDFVAQERGDAVVFRCLGCGSSWRYELGWVWCVDRAEVAP